MRLSARKCWPRSQKFTTIILKEVLREDKRLKKTDRIAVGTSEVPVREDIGYRPENGLGLGPKDQPQMTQDHTSTRVHWETGSVSQCIAVISLPPTVGKTQIGRRADSRKPHGTVNSESWPL